MTVLIADTFFPSLARLEAHEQVSAIKLLDQFQKTRGIPASTTNAWTA